MRGVYAVYLGLEESAKVKVGALGPLRFSPGIYVYVGSAMNGVESRLRRHFSSQETLHWHIDYFTAVAEPFDFLVVPESSSFECELASTVSRIGKPVDGFGCSDCGCSSHLFRIEEDLTCVNQS